MNQSQSIEWKARSGLAMIIFIAFAQSGCVSYRWGHQGRQLPGGYKSIAVPVFNNNTHEVGAEVALTNSMISEISRSQLAHLEPKDRAAVVLEGNIVDINSVGSGQLTPPDANSTAYTTFPLPVDTILNSEYRIYLTVDIAIRRSSDQKIIWQSRFTGERTFLSAKIGTEFLNSANALYNHSARQQTIQIIGADLMAQAYDQMTENF